MEPEQKNFGLILLGVALLGAIIIFGCGRRGERRIRLFPTSYIEWVAYWFHSLEFTLFCATLVIFSAGSGIHVRGARFVFLELFGSALFLLVGIIRYWEVDRRLSVAGLIWLLLPGFFALLLFPLSAS